MSNLRLVKNTELQQQLTVDELLALLGPDKLNEIDRKAKIMRESFKCPFTVPDYDAFKETLWDFVGHYEQSFFGIDMRTQADREYWKHYAYQTVERNLSYPGGMLAAERNAITGRDGGMIGIIDAVTEGITKHHTETYIRSVFFEMIAPSDYDTKMRLANELLNKYGQYLFSGEQLLPNYAIAMNIEEVIHGFATNIHAIRRQLRH